MSTHYDLSAVIRLQPLLWCRQTLLALRDRLLRAEVFHVKETAAVEDDLLLPVACHCNLKRLEHNVHLDVFLRPVHRANAVLCHRPLNDRARLWLLQ